MQPAAADQQRPLVDRTRSWRSLVAAAACFTTVQRGRVVYVTVITTIMSSMIVSRATLQDGKALLCGKVVRLIPCVAMDVADDSSLMIQV